MSLIDSLERRFGRFAISHLIRGIVILNALVFIVSLLNPGILSWLTLNVAAVEKGEYWRLLTYIFIPSTRPSFFVIFYLWFLWSVGDGLEEAWGAFRVNLFYIVGMLGTTLAALNFGADFSNSILNTSLFFAFAWFYPNIQFYLLFIIPVKVKWIAWISAALLGFQFLISTNSYRMALIAALSNYALFFGPQIIRDARQRREAAERRKKFVPALTPEEEPLHKCSVCGRSDITNPELDFRVSRDGRDYCVDHLPKA